MPKPTLPGQLTKNLTIWVRCGCGRGGVRNDFYSTGVKIGRADAYYLVLSRLNRIFENDAIYTPISLKFLISNKPLFFVITSSFHLDVGNGAHLHRLRK